jgi:hypothetical protein
MSETSQQEKPSILQTFFKRDYTEEDEESQDEEETL